MARTQICKICKKEYKNLSAHVKAHSLTWDDYLRQFDPAQYQQRAKINFLYEFYARHSCRSRFLEQDTDTYYTINCIPEGGGRTWPLNKADLKDHVTDQRTIGITFKKYKTSRFLMFDIDSDATEGDLSPKNILRGLLYTLTDYLPQNCLILSHSGKKGYHVDIVFKNEIEKKLLHEFYAFILYKSGYSMAQVEGRGFTDQGIKLPLGFHVGTGQYCFLVNEDGDQVLVPEELDHIQGLEMADPALITQALDQFYADRKTKQTIEQEHKIQKSITPLDIYFKHAKPNSRISELEEEGILDSGTRHNRALELACLYANAGLTKDQIEDKLLQWHDKLDPAYYNSSVFEIRRDSRNLAQYAEANACYLSARRPVITHAELLQALIIKGRPKRRVYYAILVHAKMFADSKTGIFYMTYSQLGQALGHSKDPDRNQLKKHIDDLAELGLVEVVRSDRVDRRALRRGQFQKSPNRYRLVNIDIKATDGFFACEKNCSNCIDVAFKFLFTPIELREHFPRRADRQEILQAVCPNQNTS